MSWSLLLSRHWESLLVVDISCPQQEENVCNFTTFPISVSFPSILLENIRKTLTTLFEHFLHRPLSVYPWEERAMLITKWYILVCYGMAQSIKPWNSSISLHCPLGQHLLIEINCDSSDQLWPVKMSDYLGRCWPTQQNSPLENCE